MKFNLCILLFILSCALFAQNWDIKPHSDRADWMAEGNYGMMVHYLPTPTGNIQEEKTQDFNNIINNFDMNKFMAAFDKSGADWLIFTIGQNVGYWNSSNPVIDNAVKGRTPDRDLVLEIAKEVKKRGKHFIVYLPGEAAAVSANDPVFSDVFHWVQPVATDEFYATWAELMKNYSDKFGKYCDGWWIDGVYHHCHNDNYDWSIWADAMRSGNPNSIVGLSDGGYAGNLLNSRAFVNDYFPGEVHNVEDGYIRIDGLFGLMDVDKKGHVRIKYSYPKYFVPKGAFLDGERLHALVPVDSSFNPDIKKEWCEYSVEDLALLTHSFHDVGGAVTLNLPVNMDGSVPEESINKLAALKKTFEGKKKYKLDPKVLERSFRPEEKNPNPKNIAFGKPAKLLSIDMSREIEASSLRHFASLGNDGHKDSLAIGGGGNWDWTYWIDLEKVTKIKEIKLFMSENNFATEFALLTSTDNENWEEVDHLYNNEELKFYWKLNKKNIRYIAIKSIVPNGAGQKGGQMAVGEIEVYK